jgi:hypothetical protein
MEYEADPKHAEMIWEEMGLDLQSKGLEKPCIREGTGEEAENGTPLSPPEASRFRAMAARANFLSLDRPDVQYAVKELCRDMAAPTATSWMKLKRLARYLLQYPRLVWDFSDRRTDSSVIRVFTDSDWAGCPKTRKSTSGGVVLFRGVAVKHWSTTQSTIALSSGEAEYVALVKAAAEGLGVQALACDLGLEAALRIGLDSSAAKSMASRSGVGRVRHLDTRRLWVQEAVRVGKFALDKVRGDQNPANILTKPLSCDQMVEEFELLGVKPVRRQ